MNPTFFQQIEEILHAERIDAYRQDGADPALTMGRYTLNMALSEALYPSLQFAEVAFDASNGAHTPFGHRWGGDVITLTSGHIEVMRSGQTLALDVMNEYVVFLKAEPEEEKKDV